MKTSIALFITGLIFSIIPASVFSQPIPAEFIAVHNYSTIGLIVSKNFSENSKFGIFHLNKLDIYYNDKEKKATPEKLDRISGFSGFTRLIS